MNDLAIDFAIIQNHRLQFLVGIGLANKNELAAIRPFRCQQRIYLVDIETGRAAWGWSKDPVNDDLLGMAAAVGFDPDDVLEFWILEDDKIAVFGEIVGEEKRDVATHFPQPDNVPNM